MLERRLPTIANVLAGHEAFKVQQAGRRATVEQAESLHSSGAEVLVRLSEIVCRLSGATTAIGVGTSTHRKAVG
jgi:hypothetical protein